jgi:predicted transcriptional regulator
MWPLQRTTDKLYTQAWLHVTSTKDNRQVVYTSFSTCDLYKGQQTNCIHKLGYMWPLQRTTDKLYTQAWLHVTSTKDNRQVVYTSLITCDLYKGQQTSCIHKLGYMWPLQRYRRVVDNRQVVYTSLITCDFYKDAEGSCLIHVLNWSA